MKKISGWLTTIFLIAVIVAAFTVPSKEKLEKQLTAGYADSGHVNINESKIKLLVPILNICTYTITGQPKITNVKTSDGKPLSLARIIKTGTYIGLLGRFWEWK
jgi:hypothetical protein